MILFFDTETSGMVDFKQPNNPNAQPDLLQLACLLTDDEGEEISSFNLYRYVSESFYIEQKAQEKHGLTVDFLRSVGVDVEIICNLFSSLNSKSFIIVAYNAKFDCIIMQSEIERLYGSSKNLENVHCAMLPMTDVCGIPAVGKWFPGKSKFKWPSLSEAYKHCFGKEIDNAHDALADVRACKEIYFWYKKNVSSVSRDAGAAKLGNDSKEATQLSTSPSNIGPCTHSHLPGSTPQSVPVLPSSSNPFFEQSTIS